MLIHKNADITELVLLQVGWRAKVSKVCVVCFDGEVGPE